MQTHPETARPSRGRALTRAWVGRELRRAAIGMAALAAIAAPAAAQQGPIVKPGNAVVTGYAGFTAYPAPEGGDPFDYLTINTAGPVARVVDLSAPGAQGVPSPAPKTFTVTAGQVGQVFGVTLDNAPQPNIYLAATSAYGLSITIPDGSPTLKRVHAGAPGAQFVPGQFGPAEWGGGPGSIWRVSGATGQVSLFANVGGGNFASLGGLAFDPTTQQIFAADRGSGVVYRLSLDGAVKGTYDHGVEGRPNAGLPPVAAPPSIPSIVSSPAFSVDNPATWGFAPPQRRVFALAVHNKRLYYSVAQGPQVWSAGISPGGSIPGKDARVEIEVPSLAADVEIASITFDGSGRMYVAERPRTTGDYYLYNLADAGVGRVLRYLPKPAGDPTPGRWTLIPEVYSVGLPPPYTNANGGVALNYGYNQSGQINLGSCGATVWSTGERLLDPGDGSTPDTYPSLDGLQGNATSAVQPQNTPPSQSWFVDFDDQPGQPGFRGYMGAIATIPCAAPTPPPAPPPVPPPVVCPPGTYFANGQCLIFPTCPPGTQFQNGQCVYPQCPPGFVLQGGQCVPPTVVCPPGNVFYQGQCVPLNCPPGLVRLPNGFCACPQNTIYVNGQCVPPNQCPQGAINLGGVCFCPNGLLQGGQCQPFTCPAGQILTIEGCKPIQCPPNQQLQNGQCVPIVCSPNQDLWNGQCVPKCQPGFVHLPPNGACGLPPPPPPCFPPNEMWNGQCVPKCPPNQVHLPPNGACGPGGIVSPCPPPGEMINGVCQPPCPPLTTRQPDGTCKPLGIINPPVICLAPNELVNGECKPPCPPLQIRQPDGTCKPIGIINPPVLCVSPNELVNGQCKPPCPPLQIRQPDGTCKPIGIINPPVLCVSPNELVNGQCKPPCPPLQIRQPDGTCKPIGIINPPVVIDPKPPVIVNPPPVIIDPPPVFDPGIVLPPVLPPPQPPKPISPPLTINPEVIKPINPQIVLPPPPPPCNPPNQMVNGECKPPQLQINPGVIQILPQIQLQP